MVAVPGAVADKACRIALMKRLNIGLTQNCYVLVTADRG